MNDLNHPTSHENEAAQNANAAQNAKTKKKVKKKRKKWKILVICIAALIVAAVAFFGGFYIYASGIFNGRIAELNEFPDFADDGAEAVFTFDLNRRDLYRDLIEEFGLDVITAGHYDVDLMIVLLNWVKDNFRHDGASGMPDNRDAMSIVNFMRENPEGINCRGLALLLAEVLRLYGIEAKHVTVMPPEDDHPVHVVTHAFSRDLQQWIMLDPSFRIYIQDEGGKFMDLYSLRRAFAEGSHGNLVHNANAAHNNRSISRGYYNMGSWDWFTASYLFRFRTATNFTFGSDEATHFWSNGSWHERTGVREPSVMLVPVGFTPELREIMRGADLVTTSANAFFALPR